MMGELQARWFSARVVPRDYADDGTIFDAAERQAMIDEVATARSKIPPWLAYRIYSIQGIAEQMAEDIGCLPPDPHTLMTSQSRDDVELGVALLYGPYTVAQYRVAGRGAWDGAKEMYVKISRDVMGQQFEDLVEENLANNGQGHACQLP